MTDLTIGDPVCRCGLCIGEGEQASSEWPDWATPRSSDWRLVETVNVAGGRL
jgi:hypothetical protein